MASSEAQRQSLWWVRETIPEANRRTGAVASHDVSVPLSCIPDFIEKASAAVRGVDQNLRVNCFGHVGDGNLHYNIVLPDTLSGDELSATRDRASRLVYDLVREMNGSISAEHGIGVLKREWLSDYKDETELGLMRTLKQALDPRNTLNPGKVI